jgi:hypothetical protein
VSVPICRYVCRTSNADPQFHFEYRGPVNMKGKSEPMNVWFLSREKEYIVWIKQRATATSALPCQLWSQRIAVQWERLPLCARKTDMLGYILRHGSQMKQSLLGYGSQQWRFSCARDYVVASWLPSHNYSWPQLTNCATYDGQSASLACCQAPIWRPKTDSYYCQTVEGLLTWDVLPEERTGL